MNPGPSTETIWAHLSAELRQFIRRRVSDEHAADDLLQETFLRIHRNLGTLQDADRLAAWVYQIARNVVRDYHRKATTSPVGLGDVDPTDECDDSSNQPDCGSARWLVEMLKSLPEGYREAVQLAEIEGRTQQQVAQQFGLTLSGAKSRVGSGPAARVVHFGFDDPPKLAKTAATEDEALGHYRRVRDEIRQFVSQKLENLLTGADAD